MIEHLKVQLLDLDVYKVFTMDDFDMIHNQAKRIAATDLTPTFQDGHRNGFRNFLTHIFDRARIIKMEDVTAINNPEEQL
jgi:hypothetical protein